MANAQTQSLPTWAPVLPPVTCKPSVEDEDPLYLSGEETDCDSERGSDTLSREDQQLMASFINLQRQRKSKQMFQQQQRTATRAAPVLIPAQTREYVPTSTKQWIWDEDEEDNEWPCCNQSEHRAPEADVADASDLLFDLEL